MLIVLIWSQVELDVQRLAYKKFAAERKITLERVKSYVSESSFAFQGKKTVVKYYTPLLVIKRRFVSGCIRYTSPNKGTKQSLVFNLSWSRTECEFKPMNLALTSNFNWAVNWIILINSRMRVIVEKCSLLFILFTARIWNLRSCLGW